MYRHITLQTKNILTKVWSHCCSRASIALCR